MRHSHCRPQESAAVQWLNSGHDKHIHQNKFVSVEAPVCPTPYCSTLCRCFFCLYGLHRADAERNSHRREPIAAVQRLLCCNRRQNRCSNKKLMQKLWRADILQDTWMRVIRSLVRLRDPMRLAPWMYCVARLAVMNHLRVRYRCPPDTELVDVSSFDDGIENLFNLDEVEVALAELHPIAREVVVLFYCEQRSSAPNSIFPRQNGCLKQPLPAPTKLREVHSTPCGWCDVECATLPDGCFHGRS